MWNGESSTVWASTRGVTDGWWVGLIVWSCVDGLCRELTGLVERGRPSATPFNVAVTVTCPTHPTRTPPMRLTSTTTGSKRIPGRVYSAETQSWLMSIPVRTLSHPMCQTSEKQSLPVICPVAELEHYLLRNLWWLLQAMEAATTYRGEPSHHLWVMSCSRRFLHCLNMSNGLWPCVWWIGSGATRVVKRTLFRSLMMFVVALSLALVTV